MAPRLRIDTGTIDAVEAIDVHGDESAREAVKVKVAPAFVNPAKEEVSAHDLTHQPFMNRWEWCVMGKTQDARHSASNGARDHPIVSIDYAHLFGNREGTSPTRVGRCNATRCIGAWVAARTGNALRAPQRVAQ